MGGGEEGRRDRKSTGRGPEKDRRRTGRGPEEDRRRTGGGPEEDRRRTGGGHVFDVLSRDWFQGLRFRDVEVQGLGCRGSGGKHAAVTEDATVCLQCRPVLRKLARTNRWCALALCRRPLPRPRRHTR